MLGAKYFGIRQEYVCVGNGAAELIKSLMRCITGDVGVVYPTFEEYPNRLEPERIVAYVPENADFAYTAADLTAFFGSRRIEALLLINPDNPSGNYIPKNEVLELAVWCAGRESDLWSTNRSSISPKIMPPILCCATRRSKRIPSWS